MLAHFGCASAFSHRRISGATGRKWRTGALAKPNRKIEIMTPPLAVLTLYFGSVFLRCVYFDSPSSIV
jgi:hypothetical protein